MIHENSKAAKAKYKARLGKREQMIYDYLLANRAAAPISDREVRMGLFTDRWGDMNMVRPRITTMIRNGWLEEVDKVEDPVTHTPCRRTRARTAAERLAYLASKAEWEQDWLGMDVSNDVPERSAAE